MFVQGAQHDLFDPFGHQRHDQVNHALFVESSRTPPPFAAPFAPFTALVPVVVMVMVIVFVVMMLAVSVMMLAVSVVMLVVMMMPAVGATALAIAIPAAARVVMTAHGNLLWCAELITPPLAGWVVAVPAATQRR